METMSIGEGSNCENSSDATSYMGYTNATENQIRNLAREFTRLNDVRESSPESANASEKSEDGESVNSELSRTISLMSQVPGVTPIGDGIDPRLDPSSDSFESKFWIKNMRKLFDTDPDYYKPTSLGFACKNLVAKGISSDADYQSNVLNYPFKKARDFYLDKFRGNDESRYFEILKSMDCLIKPGTLTVVLGRPGAGCSTFLKTVAAQTYGFKVDQNSIISYDGLTPEEIDKHYRGEVIFSAEMDNHFPHLTVGETLEFAARLRTPQNRFPGVDRVQYAKHMSQVSIEIN